MASKTDNIGLDLYDTGDAANLRDQYNSSMHTLDETVTVINTNATDALTKANTAIDNLESLGVTDTTSGEALKNTIENHTTDIASIRSELTTTTETANRADTTADNALSLATTNESDIADIEANLNALHANTVSDATSLYETVINANMAITPVKNQPTNPYLYVACSNGNDETGDGSQTNPYRTIAHAINTNLKENGILETRIMLAEAGNYPIYGNSITAVALHIRSNTTSPCYIDLGADTTAYSEFSFYHVHLNINASNSPIHIMSSSNVVTSWYDEGEVVSLNNVVSELSMTMYNCRLGMTDCQINNLRAYSSTVAITNSFTILNTDPNTIALFFNLTNVSLECPITVTNLSETGTVQFMYLFSGEISCSETNWGTISTITNKYLYGIDNNHSTVRLTTNVKKQLTNVAQTTTRQRNGALWIETNVTIPES